MCKYYKNEIVEGCVTGIEKYGIFITLDEYYSGLIHISEISDGFVKDINKYALPLLENDFSCLPPCFSFVGTIDPFYEETKEYVSRLKKANVEVSFKFFEGCYHAFDMMVPHAKESKEAVDLFLKSFDYAVKYYQKNN